MFIVLWIRNVIKRFWNFCHSVQRLPPYKCKLGRSTVTLRTATHHRHRIMGAGGSSSRVFSTTLVRSLSGIRSRVQLQNAAWLWNSGSGIFLLRRHIAISPPFEVNTYLRRPIFTFRRQHVTLKSKSTQVQISAKVMNAKKRAYCPKDSFILSYRIRILWKWLKLNVKFSGRPIRLVDIIHKYFYAFDHLVVALTHDHQPVARPVSCTAGPASWFQK